MAQHISGALEDAKRPSPSGQFATKYREMSEIGSKMPTTTNNMVRVHPAQPSYSVVVPAPEPFSINVAVVDNIDISRALRKGIRMLRILIADTPAPHREQAEAAVGSQPWARFVVDSILKDNGE